MSDAFRRRVSLWAPVVLYMALIFALSSTSRPPDVLPPSLGDKGGHSLLYAGLAALLVRALAGGWLRPLGAGVAFAAVALSTSYGATDEIHEMFVPLRTPELADLAADAVGSAAAVAFLYGVHALRARIRR
jgi:VanZ family protein